MATSPRSSNASLIHQWLISKTAPSTYVAFSDLDLSGYHSTMAEQSRTFRTASEVAVIALVIYILLGAPGLSSTSTGPATGHEAGDTSAHNSATKIEHLVYPSKAIACPRHEYVSHIFSTAPLVVYVDGFLAEHEVDHLIDLR